MFILRALLNLIVMVLAGIGAYTLIGLVVEWPVWQQLGCASLVGIVTWFYVGMRK